MGGDEKEREERKKGDTLTTTHMSTVPPPPVEKLTLAYRELYELDSRIVQQFGPTVKQLDLSNNNIRYLNNTYSILYQSSFSLFFLHPLINPLFVHTCVIYSPIFKGTCNSERLHKAGDIGVG